MPMLRVLNQDIIGQSGNLKSTKIRIVVTDAAAYTSDLRIMPKKTADFVLGTGIVPYGIKGNLNAISPDIGRKPFILTIRGRQQTVSLYHL